MRIAELPYLGAGLSFRKAIADEIFEHSDDLDVVEIVTEHFLASAGALRAIDRLRERFAIVPHGLGLSIGSAQMAVDADCYLRSVKRISDRTRAPYYSDHLSLTRVPGIDVGALSPLWFTEDLLKAVVANVLYVQEFLERPLVLETIASMVSLPSGGLDEPAFFRALVEQTGCGILLDITNVVVNGHNQGFKPIDWIRSLPLDRISQVHLAGGHQVGDVMVDSHSEPVDEVTWSLLTKLASLTNVSCAIVEQDVNFPTATEGLFEQVSRARRSIAPTIVHGEA